MKPCAVEGCERNTWATGDRIKRVTNKNALIYCRKHCRWIALRGAPSPAKFSRGGVDFRFWKHVEKGSPYECWNWTAYKGNRGYGRLWDLETEKNRLAHRVSYELAKGKIPDGLVVMHTCDNPSCVNPDHLVTGTYKNNTQDMLQKGRRKAYRAFGENNPVSKLTLEQAKFIKAHPELGNKQIADMWGLSPNCIRSVRIGRTWKDA